jgi:hypothetical protein
LPNKNKYQGGSLVNNIIQQICENYISEVLNFFGTSKIRTIDEMETELKEKTNCYLRNMMKIYIERLDEAIAEDKESRKKKGYVIEQKAVKREIYTQFGNLEFKRRYYKNKLSGTYSYLVDKVVGIESYDRVSSLVSAALVESASELSYTKSSKYVCDGNISRQTVMNKIRRTKELKIKVPEEKRKVRYLNVEADEDHVSLQDGTNTIVPLISIHEGVERIGKRGKCINIHHISSYGKSIDDIWQEAAEWIYAVYDVDEIEKIYLHGDGASWIKTGLNYIPKAQFVLDRYHLNKAIKEAARGDEIICTKLRNTVTEADKESFKEVCRELWKNAETEKNKEKVNSFRNYIIKNWDGIVAYKDEASRGSNTEGHISHVLSSRLSSRPSGWSREGLKAMAELRAYCCSGGHIETKHIKKTEVSYKVPKKMLDKVSKVYRKASKEIVHNITIINNGKVNQLSRALRNLRNGNDII